MAYSTIAISVFCIFTIYILTNILDNFRWLNLGWFYVVYGRLFGHFFARWRELCAYMSAHIQKYSSHAELIHMWISVVYMYVGGNLFSYINNQISYQIEILDSLILTKYQIVVFLESALDCVTWNQEIRLRGRSIWLISSNLLKIYVRTVGSRNMFDFLSQT